MVQDYAEITSNIVVAVQIESKQAVSQVQDIAKVEGILVLVGPSDLSADYNLIGKIQDPEFQNKK